MMHTIDSKDYFSDSQGQVCYFWLNQRFHVQNESTKNGSVEISICHAQ